MLDKEYKEVIWNHESAQNIIGATISLHRFKFVCHLIIFDNKETQSNRWKTDKFACMKNLFEDLNERNARMKHPSPMLAIDESLYPYRGHIGFKQHNPNKAATYGLLYEVSGIFCIALSHMRTGLQHAHCIVTMCQLINLLREQ